MSHAAEFVVEVAADDAVRFAELSGDWNPLHVDADYAATTAYHRPVLHGAFAAGLVSRMAGMHLPGKACLLHAMKLRFITPMIPPAKLTVRGRPLRQAEDGGAVEVLVTDAVSGVLYVEAHYDYGFHAAGVATAASPRPEEGGGIGDDAPVVLVTGASGGLARALLANLGHRGIGLSRGPAPTGIVTVETPNDLPWVIGERRLEAIVHCGWPAPDNRPLTRLDADAANAVDNYVGGPLKQTIGLAQALIRNGLPGAALVLVGSTAASPGRHAYRSPLYSVGKAMIPALVHVLSVELGASGKRCFGVEFDVIDGDGMNGGMRPVDRLRHLDRTPAGHLATTEEAAGQIAWMLDNPSTLLSGAIVSLTGGALP